MTALKSIEYSHEHHRAIYDNGCWRQMTDRSVHTPSRGSRVKYSLRLNYRYDIVVGTSLHFIETTIRCGSYRNSDRNLKLAHYARNFIDHDKGVYTVAVLMWPDLAAALAGLLFTLAVTFIHPDRVNLL